jgi:prolyl-tRNA synthetase
MKNKNFSNWYQQIIKLSDLAEMSKITKGCMIIKPWGYKIWNIIHKILDQKLQKTGCLNVYFPTLIPSSLFEKNIKNLKMLSKECITATHSKLKVNFKKNKIDLCSILKDPLVIRPTSEVIISESFSNWVQSYRDLPIKINQWSNAVRWEMKTKIFIRTSEFLWQEGHTVHSNSLEAIKTVLSIKNLYKDFIENYLGIPVFEGIKTKRESFPGSLLTFSLEAMTKDKKSLQIATSHFLGQNFSKTSNIKFINKMGDRNYGWTTSWGTSTRLIGAIIMVHADDNGIKIPPLISPIHVVIIPKISYSGDLTKNNKVLKVCTKIKKFLENKKFSKFNQKIKLDIDNRKINGGLKKWDWIKKGIPIQIEIGMREIKNKKIGILRRDNINKKIFLGFKNFNKLFFSIKKNLEEIQNKYYFNALKNIKKNSFFTQDKKTLKRYLMHKKGFFLFPWKEDNILERKLKAETNMNIRCLSKKHQCNSLINGESISKKLICPFSKCKTKRIAILAKSY